MFRTTPQSVDLWIAGVRVAVGQSESVGIAQLRCQVDEEAVRGRPGICVA